MHARIVEALIQHRYELAMPRLLLNDELWSQLREILLHKAIYNKRDLRMTVEDMLYRMRTGCHWRDLPKAFENWNKVYKLIP